MSKEEEIRKLTEEECLVIGGHCYDYEPYVLASDPPISVRKCKHCGHTQHGVPQPSMSWEWQSKRYGS